MSGPIEIVPVPDPGLGNHSYLLREGDAACVIDPVRDVRRYLEIVEGWGARIAAAFDTHLHADFVGGARELAALGAEVYASADADLAYPHRRVRDGETLELDGLALTAIASPGHAPEHVSLLLGDSVLFSGGALLPGGAARTDLLGPERTEELGRALFATLHERFAGLPDDTRVYPTHGAGSYCSAGGGGGATTTLGAERRTSPLFAARRPEELVEHMRAGRFPAYFRHLREVNRGGPRVLGAPALPKRLDAADAAAEVGGGAWPVDVRRHDRYEERHLRGSVNASVDASFEVWLGWAVPFGSRLLLVAEDERQALEAGVRAAGIGYEDVAGWAPLADLAAGGLPTAATEVLDAAEVARRLDGPEPPTLLDVRRPEEVASGVLPGARTVEAGRIVEEPPAGLRGPIVAYCATGNRSAVVASVLERAGVGPVAVFPGGPAGWRASGRALERPAG